MVAITTLHCISLFLAEGSPRAGFRILSSSHFQHWGKNFRAKCWGTWSWRRKTDLKIKGRLLKKGDWTGSGCSQGVGSWGGEGNLVIWKSWSLGGDVSWRQRSICVLGEFLEKGAGGRQSWEVERGHSVTGTMSPAQCHQRKLPG